MQGYNVIILYNESESHILMCRRKKDPYKGLYNLNGGKIELGEAGLAAAYRELYEETNVDEDAVRLVHVMDFTYHLSDCYVEVYAGKLRQQTDVCGDENDLCWIALDQNFFDMTLFAGEGNIGHMLELVQRHRALILGE